MTPLLVDVLLPATVAFVLTAALVPAVKALALQTGFVAVPKADRWHRTAIPLLGGLAIVGGTLGGVATSRPSGASVWVLLVCAIGLAGVGLVDDLRTLRPQSKLILQILFASAMTAVGLQFQFTGVVPLDMLITLVWLVGITNAFNLLDNMDGLAAGIAAIVAAFRLAFFLADGDLEGAMLAGVLLGACLGFLLYNFNPASIFMGDTGSLFLGFMVAGLSLVGGWPYSRGTALVLVFPVLVVLVPIFDTTFVTVARILAGRPVSQGGRDHTSHRLVALGMSERQAVLVLYALAMLGGGIAWMSYRYGLSYGAVFAMLLVLATLLFGVFLGRLKVYPDDGEQRSAFATLLVDFSYKRQVATVALDTVIIIVAYYSAYLLRFESAFQAEQTVFRQSLPIVVAAQIAAFLVLGTHRGVWRYTGVSDLLRLGRACVLGTTVAVLGVLVLYRFEGYSRAVFALHAVLLFVLVAASRTSFRALDETFGARRTGAAPVVVYGAGKGGVMVLRELSDNEALGWRVAAFVDDDRGKQGTRIQGVPVEGGVDRLEDILSSTRAEHLIVSSAKIPDSALHDVRARCRRAGVSVLRASLIFE